jgi:glycosyltransferase involved in cell wall biosynthesis
LKIAIDASALSTPANGIGRYVSSLLSAMLSAGSGHEWLLYGRDGNIVPPRGPRCDAVRVRADHMPVHAGRLLSLGTSQPVWAARDCPDVFWGPAHRLPIHLPRTTARVVTIHDLCWLRAPGTMRLMTRWIDRVSMPRAVQYADRVIAVSSSTRDDLAASFPRATDRLRVVYEAGSLMPKAGTLDRLHAIGIRRPFILFVGTLEPRKNLVRLVEALARLPGTGKAGEATLVLAGALGWHHEPVSGLARRLGVETRLRHLGKVDDATLATLYTHAEFLVMPSLYEGFGLPILESLSQGTPVLHGDNSSMPEVAGKAGVAVDAFDVDSIAQGMTRLLSDHALLASVASHAREQAARFSWERAARETLAVFEEAAAARQARMA